MRFRLYPGSARLVVFWSYVNAPEQSQFKMMTAMEIVEKTGDRIFGQGQIAYHGNHERAKFHKMGYNDEVNITSNKYPCDFPSMFSLL